MSQRPFEQNIQRDKVLWESRVTGPVSCFASSTLEPEKLAIGCDHILIKNLDNQQWRKFNISRHSAVHLTVTCIAWHPKEPILGLGCETGVVGVLDVDETAVNGFNLRFFVHKHKSVIFSLAWAPCSKNSDASKSAGDRSKLFLYSCGCGRICINDPYNPGVVPRNFDDIVIDSGKPFYTEICWKSDYTQVAVAVKNGFQNIYDGITFNLLFRISVVREVWCFRWHPFSLPNSAQSTLHNWIAVSLNHPDVYVYDLGIGKASETDTVPVLEPIRELSGHLHNVNKIDWSPHVDGRLASCSKDGTVQIWDVISGRPLVNFNHDTPVLAVKWMLLDSDQVVSSDTNGRIYSWRPSEQAQTPLDPDRVRRFQRRGGYHKKPQHAAFSNENGNSNAIKEKTAQPATRKEREGARRFQRRGNSSKKQEPTVPDQMTVGHVTSNIKEQPVVRKETEDVPAMKMQSFQKQTSIFFPQHDDDDIVTESNAKAQQRTNADTLEPIGNCDGSLADALGNPPDDQCTITFALQKLVIWKRDHFEECKKILELPRSEIPENTLLSAFIGKAEDFYKLITLCSACPYNFANYNEYVHRILQRSITEVLSKPLTNANSFLIGLTMAGSKRDWLSACFHSYKQFMKFKTNRNVWSNFLLASNQFSEAFNQMEREKHTLEAYAISKRLFPEEGSVVKKCQLNMLRDFQRKNRYELYCLFCLLRNDVLEAAKELNKRFSSVAASLDAAYLCRNHGFMDEALKYSFLCILKGFYQKKYDDVKAMIVEQPEAKNLHWVIAIYEVLINDMAAMNALKKYGICEGNLFQNEESSEKSILWKSYNIEGVDSLSHVLKSLKDKEMLDFESSDFLNTFTSFKDFVNKFIKKDSMSDCDIMIHVTFSICDFFVTLHLENSEEKFNEAFQSISNTMKYYFDNDNFSALNKICLLFFPFDMLWNNREKTLEVQLNSGILSENVIKAAYEWMAASISLVVKDNVDAAEKLKEQVNDQLVKKRFTEKALRKELLNISSVDIIFTYFVINYIKMLSKKAKNSVAKRFDRHHKCKNFIPAVLENASIALIKENIGDPHQIAVLKEILEKNKKPEEKELTVPEGKEPLEPAVSEEKELAVPENKEPLKPAVSKEKELAVPENKEPLKPAVSEERELAIPENKELLEPAASEKKKPIQTTVPEEKEQEMCNLCKSKIINDEGRRNCCLSHLKPFFHLLSIITANICNDVFKINSCFLSTQFPEASNFWNMTIVSKTTTELGEFCSSVDDFVNDRNKLLDLLIMLEEKNQVKKFPDVMKAAQILKASVEKIMKSCMCPCMKYELRSLVIYLSKRK